MKAILITAILIISFQIQGISKSDSTKLDKAFELSAAPLGVYNNLSVGFSIMNSKNREHVISLNSNKFFANIALNYNINLTYSRNFYAKNGNDYGQLWSKIAYNNANLNFEQTGALHTLQTGLGFGAGSKKRLSNRLSLRYELGAGIALRQTSSEYYSSPFKTNFTDFKIMQGDRFYYPITPMFKAKIGLVIH